MWDNELWRLVQQFRQEQLLLADRVGRETATLLVSETNPDDIDSTVRPTVEAVDGLAALYASKQADLVEDFLRAFVAQAAWTVGRNLVDDVVREARRPLNLFNGDTAFYLAVRPKELIKEGLPPKQAVRAASARASGKVQRETLDKSVEPVVNLAYRTGTKYYRSCAWGACGFCVMLAGRGAVYSEGNGDFKSHEGCRCGAYPKVVGTDIAPIGEVSKEMWETIVKEQPWATGDMNLSEFRKRWKQYQVKHGIID